MVSNRFENASALLAVMVTGLGSVMSSLHSVMRCADGVRRKPQRSSRLRPIFPGRVGVSIGRDAEPSDQRRAQWVPTRPPGVAKMKGGSSSTLDSDLLTWAVLWGWRMSVIL